MKEQKGNLTDCFVVEMVEICEKERESERERETRHWRLGNRKRDKSFR